MQGSAAAASWPDQVYDVLKQHGIRQVALARLHIEQFVDHSRVDRG